MSKNKDNDYKQYINHPDISWVIDVVSTRLINEKTHAVKILKYPEAAIWDFITRGYPTKKMISLISTIAYLNTSHALTLINDTLEDLHRQGFIIEKT